jgi:hypothetical protein
MRAVATLGTAISCEEERGDKQRERERERERERHTHTERERERERDHSAVQPN